MENHCVVFSYSIRKSKKNKLGLSPIEVSISYNGERIYFSTGKFIKPSDWNVQKQLVKGTCRESNLVNAYLIELRNKVYQKEIKLMKRGFLITANLLKDALFDKVEILMEKTLLQVIRGYNAEKQKLIGNGVAPATYYCFEHTCNLLSEFISKKYKRDDCFLNEVNLAFMQSFHTFLIKDREMLQNTCTKHLKFLKHIMSHAASNNYIPCSLIASYKIERKPVEPDFLDDDELRRIINFDTSFPRLEKARDFFLFGCFTGLSYIDIKTLETKHFERDGEGRLWIKKKRVKTGIMSRIPLLPMAKMILEKYRGNDKLLPIQAPSDINKYLKDIAVAKAKGRTNCVAPATGHPDCIRKDGFIVSVPGFVR